MTDSDFETGQRVVITSGENHGRTGTIIEPIQMGDVRLVKVDVDGRGPLLFRTSLLAKERK